MKDRRIEVKVGKTINLGNYESERIDIALGGTIENDEDVNVVYDEVFELLSDELNKRVENL